MKAADLRAGQLYAWQSSIGIPVTPVILADTRRVRVFDSVLIKGVASPRVMCLGSGNDSGSLTSRQGYLVVPVRDASTIQVNVWVRDGEPAESAQHAAAIEALRAARGIAQRWHELIERIQFGDGQVDISDDLAFMGNRPILGTAAVRSIQLQDYRDFVIYHDNVTRERKRAQAEAAKQYEQRVAEFGELRRRADALGIDVTDMHGSNADELLITRAMFAALLALAEKTKDGQ